MLPMQVIVTREGWPAAPKKALRTAMRDSLRNIALQWHRQNLPEHFTDSAFGKYGYQKRHPRYLKRKRRSRGHQRPLEWTGKLKREATSFVEVKATSKNARAKFRAQAANFAGKSRRRGAAYPNIRDELRAVTEDEIKTLARTGRRYGTRALNRYRGRKRKTYR
jgi:hypothetical protein